MIDRERVKRVLESELLRSCRLHLQYKDGCTTGYGSVVGVRNVMEALLDNDEVDEIVERVNETIREEADIQ